MINNMNRGFTLVETLGAILLLSIALAGPMVIAEKGLQAALISKDQDAAFYLAQDAVEYIRFARDTNCLAYAAANPSAPACAGTSAGQWRVGNGNAAQTVNLGPCVGTASAPAACTVDELDGTAPTTCAGGVCPVINYDSGKNIYTYLTGTASIFTRTITVTSPVCNSGNTVCNNDEAALTVTVNWKDPQPHSVTVKEELLDWQ